MLFNVRFKYLSRYQALLRGHLVARCRSNGPVLLTGPFPARMHVWQGAGQSWVKCHSGRLNVLTYAPPASMLNVPQSFGLPAKPAYQTLLQVTALVRTFATGCTSLSSHSQLPLSSSCRGRSTAAPNTASLSTSWALSCPSHTSFTDDDFPFLPSTFIPQLPAALPPHLRSGINS